MFITKNTRIQSIHEFTEINGTNIQHEKEVKLLGIIID